MCAKTLTNLSDGKPNTNNLKPIDCTSCDGTGNIKGDKCKHCNGVGKMTKAKLKRLNKS